MTNKQNTGLVPASLKGTVETSKADLCLDLVQLPVAPIAPKAKYYEHQIGDKYSHKVKGVTKQDVRKNNRVAIPTAKALADAGVENPAEVQNKMGQALKNAATAAMNNWNRDPRVICTGITQTVDAAGMPRMSIGLKQTTAQRLYATLIQHGVPPKKAKAFAAQFES